MEATVDRLRSPHGVAVDGVALQITPTVRVNPLGATRFWNKTRLCGVPIIAGTVICLPKGAHLLGEKKLGSRIFVGFLYPDILDHCWTTVESVATTPKVIIKGVRGGGKTYFGFLLLLNLARIDATVVYEAGAKQRRFLFSRSVVAEGSLSDFDELLALSTTYYMVDASRPRLVSAKTILLTSLNRSVWWQFSKVADDVLHLSTWTWVEVELCRHLLYPSLDITATFDSTLRWGGVPRYVLEKASVRRYQQSLTQAIRALTLRRLVDAFSLEDTDDHDKTRLLVHYVTTPDFDVDHVAFASQWVQQEVYTRLLTQDRQRLMDFIRISDGIGGLGELRGLLYEAHVHTVLARGGVFRMKDLDGLGGEAEHVGITVSGAGVFERTADVSAAGDGTYLRPVRKEIPFVDSIIKPDRLFLVTGRHKRPCAPQHIENMLDMLGDPVAPRIYIVVHPEQFGSFFDYEDLVFGGIPRNIRGIDIQVFAVEVPVN